MLIHLTPQRRVNNNVVTSSAMPAIRVKVHESLNYLGNYKFIIMDMAKVDLYLFAETEDSNIKRLFLVQFEGYLPDNEYSYDYPIKDQITLGKNLYLHDGGILKLDRVQERRPEGDIAKWIHWLQEKGFAYELWKELAYHRFVRLIDSAKRNELLMIYFENLQDQGLQADNLLNKDGAQHEQLPGLLEAVQKRALESFEIAQG